jgi:hypothetical protein
MCVRACGWSQTLITGMIIVVCGSVFGVFLARKSLQVEEDKGRLPKVGVL